MRPLLLVFLAACASADSSPTPSPAEPTHVTEAVPPAPTERVDHQAELPPAPPGEATFQPPARGDYPEGAFGDAVRRGEALFKDTPTYAGDYMGNQLSCSNCHIDDGRRAESGPMWAAWVSYPAYRKKNDHVNTMEERLRGCFTYSLDAQHSEVGHAPEPGSVLLTDLQAYMYWLATGAPVGASMKGRGYPKLDEPEGGYDRERGKAVYTERCATCHADDGQGARVDGDVAFPPLWGPDSYNWGAGMHRINTAAGFIWANMPLGQPKSLTEQQAWDVAAYINSKPRPNDPRDADVGPQTDARFHDHACDYGEQVDGHTLGEGVH
jgi:thiosulfate dehydrogenase